MQISILNHGKEFVGPLGVVDGMCGAVNSMYEYPNPHQAASIKDSGVTDQSTENTECILSCIFAFKTFRLL